MDEKKEEQDGSAKDDGGKTTTTEGQSEMGAPQDEDALKKAFSNALNQNVADSELDVKDKAATDGNAMTARDESGQADAPQDNAAGADKQPPSDNEDESNPGVAPGVPLAPGAVATDGTPGAVPAKRLNKTAVQEREMTAMDENNRQEQPSSDTGVSSEETLTPSQPLATPKKKSKKRKKKKTKKSHTQNMAPPPFFQYPFFGLLPQVQAAERRKRAKTKKDKPSATRDDQKHAPASPITKTAAPSTPHEQPKKIEAVKIQQKEDDNGYLNLADLQAEEKKLYGEEKKIGAPGEEYICLADANEAAGAAPGAGSKDGTSTSAGPSAKSSKPAEAGKSPSAAKSPATMTKEEFQDAVLTPRPGQKAAPAPPAKAPPPKATDKKPSMTSDASLSRKKSDKKAVAPGGPTPPRPGAPVNPRAAAMQQPAPAGSVGPSRMKPVRHPTKEDPKLMTPKKGQATLRKNAPVIPVRPPVPMGHKGGVGPYADGKTKKSATKDEFQDAVLTPINKAPPKGGGTRR